MCVERKGGLPAGTVLNCLVRSYSPDPSLLIPQARNDLKLSVSHNIQSKAAKFGFTHDRKINGKKTTFKVNYLTKAKAINGEVISQLAPNKKATVMFTDREVTNAKIALTDEQWTYEPSYNFIRKAPSLAISRPMHGGKYKFGWNLKTDDLTLEYTYKALKVCIVGI
eukprot:GHUV01057866.1.p1 GENE.GHUV01057866.1~~GHUV01057866.1.p1  ORF type:complete len:167 (-),score=25.09 GHUV01057866.1:214-714(-)